MTEQTISPKQLPKILQVNECVAKVLSVSNKPSDAQRMENILADLHQLRCKYPEYEPIISQTLFNIFDHSYYHSPEYMRLRTQVSIICGFALKPTNDMNILNQLMDRMLLIDKPKNMLYPFKSITQRTIDLYDLGNYKEKDLNSKIAYRLKMMIQVVNDSLRRKTNPDVKWLYENARKLAENHPNFISFAKAFPKPNQPKKVQKLFPREAANAFPAKPSMRRHIFSHSYE